MAITWINRGHFFAPHVAPRLVDCNFIVDSTNANGLGINTLRGQGVQNVYMQSATIPAGTPAGMGLGGASNTSSPRSYGVLGASAVTNTGSTTIAGNLGISPGTSVTGFPPGTFTGTEHIADTPAALAQAGALAAYNDLQARTPSTIATALDGQTLTAGTYKAASGTFTLAASAGGTLTLNGSATDIFVFQTTTTLVTGAGGVPVITLTGGALASNVYWAVGSSATLNSGNAGTFQGTVIANTSITDTSGGTINGSLIALNGAVTLSAATTSVPQAIASTPAVGSPNPGPGIIAVQLSDNFFEYYGGFTQFRSPQATASTSSVQGVVNVISVLGTATLAQWQAAGLPKGVTPAVGAAYIGANNSVIGGSAQAILIAKAGSGIDHIEIAGSPRLDLAPVPQGGTPHFGGWLFFDCFNQNQITAPADGTNIRMAFYMSQSSVTVSGE